MTRGPYQKRPVADRFWSHVDRSTDCWLWQQSTIRGYGAFRVGGRTVYAHRFSWELANGVIPVGMSVLHRCDTPACVRSEHLFLGTQADNIRDAAAKHRTSWGEQRLNHKVTETDVLRMRQLRGEGISVRDIAQQYPVSERTIRKILSGANWRHL